MFHKQIASSPKYLRTLMLTLSASIAISGTAFADTWPAHNHTDFDVKVYWTASGCTEIARHCNTHESKIFNVCHQEILKPDDSVRYSYNADVNKHKLLTCALDQGDLSSILRATAHKKHNHIWHSDIDGSPEWSDD